MKPFPTSLALVLLLGACTSGTADTDASSPETTTTLALLDEDAPTDGTVGSATTLGQDGSPGPTSGPPVSGNGQQSGPTGLVHPTTGTYEYTQGDGDDVFMELEVSGTPKIAFYDRRDSTEHLRREVKVRNGAFINTREQRSDGSATSAECKWTSPLILVGPDLSVGATWESQGSCDRQTDVGDFTRRRSMSGKIDAEGSVNLDGRSFVAIQFTRTTETITKGPGIDVTDVLVEVITWLPELSLEAEVRASQEVAVSGAPAQKGGYLLRLKSTEPVRSGQ